MTVNKQFMTPGEGHENRWTSTLGADVRLTDAAGRLAGRRVIGSQVLTGCRGPDTINLAVREAGEYTLSVRFSDGATRTWPVDLRTEKRAVVAASRDAGPAAR